MWALDTDREELLRILQTEKCDVRAQPISDLYVQQPKPGSVRLLWGDAEDLRGLPVAMVVPQREMGEFFAWTNTYLPSWSPITAFFRIVSDSSELDARYEEGKPFARKCESAAIGLVVGEALIQSGRRYDAERIPYNGCIVTFSFAAARGLKRCIAVDNIAKRWDSCRVVTGQDPLKVRVAELLVPWQVLVGVSQKVDGESVIGTVSTNGSRSGMVDALNDVFKSGEVGVAAWRAVTRGFPWARNARVHMRDTHEARIIALEEMLKKAEAGKNANRPIASFLVGYVASLIAPGSLKHAQLLLAYLDRFPTAVMWLGLFASTYTNSQFRLSKLAHLVWKAITDGENLLARPACDIALAELSILKDAGFFADKLQGSTRGRLVVELEPGVTTTVRWLREEYAINEPDQKDFFGGETKELMSLVKEIEILRGGLEKVAGRLARFTAKRS